ncbi:MAG: c-type cytochrome [Aggregatilineales bacterium]
MRRLIRQKIIMMVGLCLFAGFSGTGISFFISSAQDTPTTTPLPETTPDSETQDNAPLSISLQLANLSSPERGEMFFQAFQADAGFACSTCHRPDSENRLIGPGLLNIEQRAEIRVEGEDAATYLYNSIMNPDLYLVDDFVDDLMPENWGEIYSQSQIYDIVAYLLTLEGESDSADSGDAMIAAVEIPFNELPDTADAEHGAELFQTFQPDAGFACSTCHWSDREDRLIGPGLLNVPIRAETRVDDQNSFEYLYTSIVSPDSYLVADFPDDLMPENWAEIYSDEDIYDIIAYLFTLTE